MGSSFLSFPTLFAVGTLLAVTLHAEAEGPKSYYRDLAIAEVLENGKVWASHGFAQSHDVVANSIAEGQQFRINLELDGGYPYLIHAVCDPNCLELDLSLYDESGFKIPSEDSTDALPIIDVTPRWTGSFEILVDMSSCRASECTFAVAVFRTDPD